MHMHTVLPTDILIIIITIQMAHREGLLFVAVVKLPHYLFQIFKKNAQYKLFPALFRHSSDGYLFP